MVIVLVALFYSLGIIFLIVGGLAFLALGANILVSILLVRMYKRTVARDLPMPHYMIGLALGVAFTILGVLAAIVFNFFGYVLFRPHDTFNIGN
ncbi:MAG: hypothetical protein M1269_10995 [Chloroflexi bacterium]|nr:hypothetical protein [Chloroflexota bacterium]